MRKAKIVATLGPASQTVEQITELIKAGLNVARINMSHGTYENHKKVIENVRRASELTDIHVGILLDLQGPKIRVDKLPEPLKLKKGEKWVIGTNEAIKKHINLKDKFIPTIYKDLVKDSTIGGCILFDDGNLEAKALKKIDDLLEIEIVVGGELKSNKGINLPDSDVSALAFTQKDRDDLIFGLENEIDFVALSFVKCAKDVQAVKYLLHKLKVDTPIIAKIERPQAVKNIESIIDVCEGIMVARGDMGVEVGNHLVPPIQKKIISLCNHQGKFVITATQMLESMITNPRPTRAEASDVANAVWDGTDAIMLSGETASGQYPVEAVAMMEKIVLAAEHCYIEAEKYNTHLFNEKFQGVVWAVQASAALISEKINANSIVCFTHSGYSAHKQSCFRPKVPILGVSDSNRTLRRMTIYWGVVPIYVDVKEENAEKSLITYLSDQKKIQTGDKLVITHGDGRYFLPGLSDCVKVEIVKEIPKILGGSEGLEEASWDKGKILFDTNICAYCQICVNVCPYGIWEVDEVTSRTNLNSKFVHRCDLDFECVQNCPTGAIEIIPSE